MDFREVAQDQVVEEDRIGHDSALDLVDWERAVGNTLVPDQGLPKTHPPDAFDDPNRLSAFVDAALEDRGSRSLRPLPSSAADMISGDDRGVLEGYRTGRR